MVDARIKLVVTYCEGHSCRITFDPNDLVFAKVFEPALMHGCVVVCFDDLDFFVLVSGRWPSLQNDLTVTLLVIAIAFERAGLVRVKDKDGGVVRIRIFNLLPIN